MGSCPSADPQLQGNMNYPIHSPVTKRSFSTYLFQFGFFFFMCLFLTEFLTRWFAQPLCVNITSFCIALEWLQQLSGKQINIQPLQNFQQLPPTVQTCTVDKGCLSPQLNNEDNQRRPDCSGWGRLQQHHTRACSHLCCKLLPKVCKVPTFQTTRFSCFPIYKSTTINPVTYLVQHVQEWGKINKF